MTTRVTYNDPFDSAANPQTPSSDLWGQVTINAWYCALEKNYGKVPFDPARYPANQRRTAIDVSIEPLPELGITNLNVCVRHMLAESTDWRNITLTSLRDLGIQDVRIVNGQWARLIAEPNGRTYEKNGETKNETVFKFLAIYPDEEKCRAAYAANDGQAAAPQTASAPIAEGQMNANSLEKQAALQFVKVIVQNAIRGKQPAEYRNVVAPALAQFPQVSKFFTFDSPEVQELLH